MPSPRTVRVIILDFGAPKFKYLAWFLDREHIAAVSAVESVGDAITLLDGHSRVVVVLNTSRPWRQAADEVECLRKAAPGVAVVVFAEEPAETTRAALAITRPHDVEDVIRPLKGFLAKTAL